MVEAGEPALFEGLSVELDVRAGCAEHRQPGIGCPLEVGAQIVAVGVQGAAVVAGQERGCGQLGIIERVGNFERKQLSTATGSSAVMVVLLGHGENQTTSAAPNSTPA